MTAIAMANPTADTLSARQAAIRCGISHYSLLKFASMGRVRTVVKPGFHPRFNKHDVEVLALELGKSETSS
jgi:hypothetical protein